MSEMAQAQEFSHSRKLAARVPRESRGYSMIEIALVLAIGLILAAMAVPQMGSTLNMYRLQGAVASSTWAVQSVRYQALMAGYPYQVVFSSSAGTYQIQNLPAGAASFANVGTPVPLSGSAVTLNQDTTLKFSPNGSVTATTGSLTFTLTYRGS